MFLITEDLHGKIRPEDLRQIVGDNTTVVDHAMTTAEGLAHSILSARFDADKLFAAKGADRVAVLVSALSDIAIYEVVVLAQPNVDLTDRRERSQAAVRYLRDFAEGKYSVSWPLRPEEGSDDSPVEHGARPSRGNYF